MINAIGRKSRQIVQDPVLRHWLIGRVFLRHNGEPRFIAHQPPYLAHLLPLNTEIPSWQQMETPPRDHLRQSITIDLAGTSLTLDPQAPEELFEQHFDDAETLLAVHRFSWLPLLGPTVDVAWVSALWQVWAKRYGTCIKGWAWHPYTAVERAINILDFSERFGFPGTTGATTELLANHAPAIAAGLEYFGDHHTSNHLSNNGRGLFRLGLTLSLPAATEIGAQILLNEATRIFSPSGVLREGSSHYHLLLTRNYVDAWLTARAHAHPETASLEAVVRQAFSVLPYFNLTAGMPLIGDISPDAPPSYFAGLLPGGDASMGWTGNLGAAQRQSVVSLRDNVVAADLDTLRRDGWMRFDHELWSGLWHVEPEGWSHMPGHGHQDLGSFELHYGETAVFVDAGRGSYGDVGEAARYRSAHVHNTLTVDGADPYPPNRPYYDAAFRRTAGGLPPEFNCSEDTVHVEHHGYERLTRVGAVHRQWQFSEHAVTIRDTVTGTGSHLIRQALLTPLEVIVDGNTAKLIGGGHCFRLCANARLRVEPATQWLAYGVGKPASLIVAEQTATLPWSNEIILTVDQV